VGSLNRSRRIGATVRVAAFAYRPGNGNDESEYSESLTSGDGGAICGGRGLCAIRNDDRARGVHDRDGHGHGHGHA